MRLEVRTSLELLERGVTARNEAEKKESERWFSTMAIDTRQHIKNRL